MLAQIFATFGLSVFLRSGAQFLWTPNFRVVQNSIVSDGPDSDRRTSSSVCRSWWRRSER